MKRVLLTILLISSFVYNTKATHIVGGEFQFVEQRSGLYDIFLNLYFDDINGNPAAKDQNFTATIFRKSDNQFQTTVNFRLIAENAVEYENPDCKIPEVETSRITYAAEDPSTGNTGFQFTSDYNDPEGYYIVWDRCCRNDQIVNIATPGDVGMLFYLHFPPIFEQNEDLTGWSSPEFLPIPATYACVGEPFTLDFSATDIDGDSLYFSMQDPLIGNSTPDNPIPLTALPEPYPAVLWTFGNNTNNQILGVPSLSVDSANGLLSVTPAFEGLHVFSVMCEEFRNGIKIGEVRRDFQIYVYDNCQQNLAPSIKLTLGDTATYNEGDTVTIYTTSISCFDILVTDSLDLRNNEKIKIEVIPVNFTTDEDMVNAGSDEFVGGTGDSLVGWQICPPSCKDITDEPFIFDVIVKDDGCPHSKTDTVRVVLELIPEPNANPILSNSLSDSDYIEIVVYEIDTINISFDGYDGDSTNLIELEAIGDAFRLSDFGMQFENKSETSHAISSNFQWIIDCDKLQGTEKTDFKIWFILNDNTYDEQGLDSIEVNIKINNEQVIEEFNAFNIFTPNGDGINEEFVVTGIPRDNCENQYVSFEIYNRWGRKIYENDERSFSWDGDDISDGVYYYLIRYTEKSYKGYFTVLR